MLIFCHFLGYDFSVIFHGVQFQFWYFPGCAFSILVFPGCAISILAFSKLNFWDIFRGLIFLSFSRVNFHSVIFQGVHFTFWQIPIVHFLSFSRVRFFCQIPGCVISILSFTRHSCLSFSRVCIFCHFRLSIFHSSIFQVVHFPLWPLPGLAISASTYV